MICLLQHDLVLHISVYLLVQVMKGEHFVLVTGWDSGSSQVWAVNGMSDNQKYVLYLCTVFLALH